MSLVRMPRPLQLATGKQNAAKPVTKRQYDRDGAMTYARAFWDRHCSDGYVAVKKKGTPPYREVEPVTPSEMQALTAPKLRVERLRLTFLGPTWTIVPTSYPAALVGPMTRSATGQYVS